MLMHSNHSPLSQIIYFHGMFLQCGYDFCIFRGLNDKYSSFGSFDLGFDEVPFLKKRS